jgi:hypothetical protein
VPVLDLDIVDRLRAALDCEGDLPLKEIEALLLEAGETIELLRSLLEPYEGVGVVGLVPRGSA